MRNCVLFRGILIAVLVAVALVLTSGAGWTYGGGGEGTGQNQGTGATVSSGYSTGYQRWMANITDHASYQEARDRADAAEERETGRFGYQSEDTQEYYAEVDAGLSISRAAWDEQFDVAPSVRRFAIVLEQMVAGRAIKPAQAFDLLAIYAIANRHRNQR